MKNKIKLGGSGKCNPASGCCTPLNNLTRREFVKLSAIGTAFLSIPLSACNIVSKTEKGHLIPADKMLSPEWIKSLTSRGLPEVYSSLKDKLKYIGMPIGGIGCGQLYISGDGRLWLWDIFQSSYKREGPADFDSTNNKKQWRLDQFSMGGLYQNPRTSSEGKDRHKVKYGFSIH